MKTGKVIIVCGGRDYSDATQIFRVLDRLDILHDIGMVVEGASDDVTGPYIGTDYWAHQWALARGKRTARVHAAWKALGRAAGPIRNQKMNADYQPAFVLAFPGGRGTDSMIDIAKRNRVKVVKAFDWMHEL